MKYNELCYVTPIGKLLLVVVSNVNTDFAGSIVETSVLVSIGHEMVEIGATDRLGTMRFVFPFRDG